ncbi:MAG: DNA starvation/stationary phase protection protein [Tissierellia bacterium]|jgi:starvation-inducible DNA-binding protein|nr:DNA starvation/stationary phase protection protein [Tissierellia bacterium]
MKYFDKINEYLSNLVVLNVKFHNLHWNVVGIHFQELHDLTEELYDDLFEKYDSVAELLKMKGKMPLARIADYLEKASVEEVEPKDFNEKEVLEILLNDITKMKDLALEIRNEADEEGDFVVVNEFEDHISGYNKNIWFISSMLK